MHDHSDYLQVLVADRRRTLHASIREPMHRPRRVSRRRTHVPNR